MGAMLWITEYPFNILLYLILKFLPSLPLAIHSLRCQYASMSSQMAREYKLIDPIFK